MGNKFKIGLSFFSHDVNCNSDLKIKFLIAKHGIISKIIYFDLLEIIYDENGYFLNFDERMKIIFCSERKIDIEKFGSIFPDLLNENLFIKDLFEKYEILTSKRIQKNYIESLIKSKRKRCELIREYLIIEPEKEFSYLGNTEIILTNICNSGLIEIESGINPINSGLIEIESGINPQNKIKEIKVKQIKKAKKEFSPDSLKFVEWFKKLLPETTKVTANDLNNWAICYDELITIDKRTKHEIIEVCTWARQDEFWSTNFLSPLKLRLKNKEKVLYYDVFLEKYKQDKQKPH